MTALNCALKASDFTKAWDILAQCRELSVIPEDIAFYYRRAGYIFYEMGDSKMARACQLYSLKFSDSSVAHNELVFLDQAERRAPIDYSAANEMCVDGRYLILLKLKILNIGNLHGPSTLVVDYSVSKNGSAYLRI